ncbi:asparagine synthase [Amycolatopsis xylanica]|uniref:asparagine synthase n=1 Tax=Amycolatopsis xylanica TaxID=589385 RepID=UPI0015A2DB48|nr:asparagine synthase [Amycolatopsis xylanica]
MVSRDDGLLIVAGQCLATSARMRADLDKVLRSGDLTSLTCWPGSYLAILVREDSLTALVDLAGQYPLYYCEGKGETVIGTRPRGVAEVAKMRPQPDVLTLLAQVFCPAVPPLTEPRSVYSGVSRLGGGQALRVSATGSCSVWTYDRLVPHPDAHFDDAATALRAALSEAVNARVDSGGHLTADFSGGLDSSSVAFLASGRLNRPLDVFTYHNPDSPADDLVHAERYVSLDERLRHVVVHGSEDTLSYQSLSAAHGDLPDFAVAASARTRTRLARVAETGRGIHLDGDGGDALLVPPPAYLAGLAQVGAFGRLVDECRLQAKARRLSRADVMARSVRLSLTSLERALRRLALRIERPLDRNTQWSDAIGWWPEPGAELAWLTEQARIELAELVRAATANVEPYEGLAAGDFAALGELRAAGAFHRQLGENAREFGVWPHAPFLDNNVIRACLLVPAHERARKGAFKPLLRQALSGLVPGEIFSRTTKGSYTIEDYRGAKRAAASLRRRVATLKLAEQRVIDPVAVRGSLDAIVARVRAPVPALNRLLGVDLWLQTSHRDEETVRGSVVRAESCS